MSREKSTYRKQHLGNEDLNKIVKKCRSNKQMLFIKFLSITGVRISELTSIRLKDCRTMGAYMDITIKAKKTNIMIYRKIGHDYFIEITKEFRGEKYLFETSGGKPYRPEYISNQIKKIGKIIGYDISANSLRHYYVTNRINNGDDLIEISRSLGHVNLGSILQYYYTGRKVS